MDEYQQKLLHTMIRPYSENELFVDINPYSKQLMHDTFLLASKQYFDFEWFNSSLEYTKQLIYYDKYTLKSYTSNGDILINKYIRNNEIVHTDYVVFAVQIFKVYDTLDESYFTNDYTLSNMGESKINELMAQYKLNILSTDVNLTRLKHIIELYIFDLRNIILNAPVCSNDILLFRGVKHDYLNNTNNFMSLKGFQSATYSIDSAITFRKAAIYEIVIQKNTPCVAMEYISRYTKEKEILICDTAIFKSDSISKKYTIDSINLYSENGEYMDWKYIFNKIIDPTNDITNNNELNNSGINMLSNDNNSNNMNVLLPKQVETTRKIFCKNHIAHAGCKLKNNITKNNRKLIIKHNTRKNRINHNVSSFDRIDKKTRFTDPIIIDKIVRLSEHDLNDFNQFIISHGGNPV